MSSAGATRRRRLWGADVRSHELERLTALASPEGRTFQRIRFARVMSASTAIRPRVVTGRVLACAPEGISAGGRLELSLFVVLGSSVTEVAWVAHWVRESAHRPCLPPLTQLSCLRGYASERLARVRRAFRPGWCGQRGVGVGSKHACFLGSRRVLPPWGIASVSDRGCLCTLGGWKGAKLWWSTAAVRS